ncbi:unnamed protein product [Brugia pahangi]|uniref:DUF1540 domain-containing protein n=1 Tax=Brugia pahangi TaxID=6280 RepID=A0A0N4TV19_BRUPA|nr:unnamed protein product [Brugia pahangi]
MRRVACDKTACITNRSVRNGYGKELKACSCVESDEAVCTGLVIIHSVTSSICDVECLREGTGYECYGEST